MQAHINQARHNQQFIEDFSFSHPDGYFDWKVTATFYSALHFFRAFCILRKIDYGTTHHDFLNSIDPKRGAKSICPPYIIKYYKTLQRYSEQARYDVFIDHQVENELQRDNFIHSEFLLIELVKYFIKEGVPCKAERAA